MVSNQIPENTMTNNQNQDTKTHKESQIKQNKQPKDKIEQEITHLPTQPPGPQQLLPNLRPSTNNRIDPLAHIRAHSLSSALRRLL